MHHNGCNYLSMLGLKLNHVNKRGHCCEYRRIHLDLTLVRVISESNKIPERLRMWGLKRDFAEYTWSRGRSAMPGIQCTGMWYYISISVWDWIFNIIGNHTLINKANLRDLIAATGLVISNWIQVVDFSAYVTLKFDGWPKKKNNRAHL